MKEIILASFGAVGSFIAAALGGWDYALQALIIFMIVDYFMGMILAGVFKKSKKSSTGALNSNAGFKGVTKKIILLLFVLVGYQLDYVLSANFVRNTVIIALIVNELISITENGGLMGIPIPATIQKAIDILNKRGSEK